MILPVQMGIKARLSKTAQREALIVGAQSTGLAQTCCGRIKAQGVGLYDAQTGQTMGR
jgi:hypothetical protein